MMSSEEECQMMGSPTKDGSGMNTNLLSTNQQEKVDAIVAELRAAAEKATPGEWKHNPLDSETETNLVFASTLASGQRQLVAGVSTGRYAPADARLIALANPANILTLLSSLTAQSERLQAAETEMERLRDLHADAVSKWMADVEKATDAEALAESLKAEIAHLGDLQNECANMDAQITAQAETIGELVGALKPFVRLVGEWPASWPDDDYAALDADAMMEPITIGDFRRAKAALSKSRPNTGEQSQ